MRKKLTILIAVLILIGGIFVYGIRVATSWAFQGDACLVIALEIAGRTADNGAVSDDEIRVMIGDLIRASVIHGHVGADGAPTDLNGNAFVVQRDANQVSVATERCVWQPFGIERVVELESHNESLHTDSAKPHQ